MIWKQGDGSGILARADPLEIPHAVNPVQIDEIVRYIHISFTFLHQCCCMRTCLTAQGEDL